MTYFIIEHPRQGTLKDLEETDSGLVGRFSITGMRNDQWKAMRFNTIREACHARNRITRPSASECQVRRSGDWEVVA